MGARSAITSWGPSTWTLYHVVSFNYPHHPTVENRQKAFDFLYGIAHMLPCVHCRTHWTNYLELHVRTPYASVLSSRDAFSRFLVDGHNEVNLRLKRPLVPYDVVYGWYMSPRYSHRSCKRVICTSFVVIIVVWLSNGFGRRGSNGASKCKG